MIIDFLRFTFLITVFCFLPGTLIVSLTKHKIHRFDNIVVSLIVGVAGFILLSFLLGYAGLRFLAIPLVLLLDVVVLLRLLKKKLIRPKLRWIHGLITLVIVLGIICQVSLNSGSGIQNPDGSVNFTETRDSFWHIALIYELARQIPPLHPGFAPEPLNNYHYFFNLFASQFYTTGGFDIYDLYYRFLPVFMSGLLGATVFVLARKIIKNELLSVTAVFLTYFTGSFGWIVGRGESAFWVSQTFTMLMNPPLSLSLPIFLIGIYVLYDLYVIYGKRQYRLWLLVLLISLVLNGIKIYAGLLFLGGISVMSFIKFIKTKSITILLLPLISIAGFIFYIKLGGINDAGNFLTWAPGWFLRAMMEAPDRLGGLTDWTLREETYLAYNNWFGVWRLRLLELPIFIAGNLGIRVWGLLMMTQIPFYLSAVIVVSLLFPLFFVQNGSIANTIQFFYYALPLTTVLTTLLVSKIKNTAWKIVIIIVLIIIALPTTISYCQAACFNKGAAISKEELSAMEIVKKDSDQSAIIFVPPVDNIHSLKTGVLSAKRVWYADRLMAENTHKLFKKREEEGERFFSKNENLLYKQQFLQQYPKIKYIYQEKNINYQKLPEKLLFKVIYETENNILYERM